MGQSAKQWAPRGPAVTMEGEGGPQFALCLPHQDEHRGHQGQGLPAAWEPHNEIMHEAHAVTVTYTQ